MDLLSCLAGFALTFLAGTAGFWVLRILRVPSAAMIGSMIVTSAMSAAGHYPVFPVWAVSFAANTMIGAMIGRQISKDIFARIRALAKCVLLQAVGMISLSLATGYILFYSTNLPLKTALLGATTGGIAEMTLFAMSLDADATSVAFLQFARLITFLVLTPYFAALARKYLPSDAPASRAEPVSVEPFSRADYLLLVPVALAGAWLGQVLRIPVGAMLGAIVTCGAFALIRSKKYQYTPQAIALTQILTGLVMGSRATPDIVRQLGELLAPALFSTSILLVGNIALAYLLHRTQGWDYATCLLCTSPAGMTQSALIAEEMGADPFNTTVFHTVRFIGIILFYPWFIVAAVQ